MPLERTDHLQRLAQIRALWQELDRRVDYGVEGFTNPIQGLRGMEEGTLMVQQRRPDMVDRGYHRTPGLDGYAAWLQAFQVLDPDLSQDDHARIDRASGVIRDLRADFTQLGQLNGTLTNGQAADYRDKKLQQLRETGETYMLSGHKEHFNITRIRQLPGGSYSYTLYDSGHETRIVGSITDEHGQMRRVVNAVEERPIRPGTDIGNGK